MIEVVVKLRFITPSLGHKRSHGRYVPDKMLKDKDGRVIFLPRWWNAVLAYGADALSKYQGEICKIQWDPIIDGKLDFYDRYYTGSQYRRHEAFLADSVIGVKAMIPSSIPIEDFQRVLELAGTYKGISPYGHDKGFGRFVVESVRKT